MSGANTRQDEMTNAAQIALVAMLEEIEANPSAFGPAAVFGACSQALEEIRRLREIEWMYKDLCK